MTECNKMFYMNNDPEYVNKRQQHSHSQLIDSHIHQFCFLSLCYLGVVKNESSINFLLTVSTLPWWNYFPSFLHCPCLPSLVSPFCGSLKERQTLEFCSVKYVNVMNITKWRAWPLTTGCMYKLMAYYQYLWDWQVF